MSSVDRSLLRDYPEIKALLERSADEQISKDIEEEQRSIGNRRTSMDPPPADPEG